MFAFLCSSGTSPNHKDCSKIIKWLRNDISQLPSTFSCIPSAPVDLYMSSLLKYSLTYSSCTKGMYSLLQTFPLFSGISGAGLASKDWGEKSVQYLSISMSSVIRTSAPFSSRPIFCLFFLLPLFARSSFFVPAGLLAFFPDFLLIGVDC